MPGEANHKLLLLVEVPTYCKEEKLDDLADEIRRHIHLGVNSRARVFVKELGGAHNIEGGDVAGEGYYTSDTVWIEPPRRETY